ncbi:hypothetical protein CEXT_631451 [Caerostris extrusa]|uniref:Uncharacterized protein n=1 Tax=Caerostris extrusa TaxID=172846 RepID=A0AAV4Y463_CAEEX|nr:hypothetical protein CEXT_631451 [Caerostris extrusa]
MLKELKNKVRNKGFSVIFYKCRVIKHISSSIPISNSSKLKLDRTDRDRERESSETFSFRLAGKANLPGGSETIVIKSVSCSPTAFHCVAAEIENPSFAFGTGEGFYCLRNCQEKEVKTIVIKRVSYSPTAFHSEAAEIENSAFAGTGEGFYSLRNCQLKRGSETIVIKRVSCSPTAFHGEAAEIENPAFAFGTGEGFYSLRNCHEKLLNLSTPTPPLFKEEEKRSSLKRVSYSLTAIHCEAAEIENPASAFGTGEGFYSLRNCHEKDGIYRLCMQIPGTWFSNAIKVSLPFACFLKKDSDVPWMGKDLKLPMAELMQMF